MKISRYNIKRQNDLDIVLYNMMSGGILKLDNKFSKIIDDLFSNKLKYQDISNPELKKNLLKGGFFVKNNFDEVEYLKYLSKLSRVNNKTLSLTLAPTLNCNFDCPYCYEKGFRQNSMCDETIDKLIHFMKHYKESNNIKNLNIAWYGGEPLLALDKIRKIKTKIDEEILHNSNIIYSSSMITNGYLLNEQTILELIDLGVERVQITLDGPKEIHDQRRFLVNKGETYDRIINNIVKIDNRIHVSIRINIDKENEKETFKLLDELKSKDLQDKIYIYVASVDPINDEDLENVCLKVNKYNAFEVKFLIEASNMGFKCGGVPQLAAGICGAVNEYCFVIDSHGDVHKCWNTVGQKDLRLGNLLDNSTDIINIMKWSNYDFLKDDECKDCKILPLCMGGCPYHNLKVNKRCSSLKDNIESVVDLNYNKYINSLANQSV